MKLGTVSVNGAQRVAVAVSDDRAVLLYSGLTMPELIEDWAAARDAVRPRGHPRARKAVPVSELTWLPPVPRPGKVICVALNNSANAGRIMSGPGTPATFNKPATSLLGHGQPIRLKKEFGRVHPEPELAVVIGTGGADIGRDDAMSHVFGYTIINDLTSPTMRTEDTFHYRAIHPRKDGTEGIEYVDTWVSYSGRYKGSDGFGPIGPWIATADEIADPHALTVTCVHQGRVITEDCTAEPDAQGRRRDLLHVRLPDARTRRHHRHGHRAEGVLRRRRRGPERQPDRARRPDRGHHLRHRHPQQPGGGAVTDPRAGVAAPR